MDKKKKFLIIIFLVIVNCNKTEPRGPINFNKKNFLNNSVDRNIEINKKEKLSFLGIIEKDSKSKYIASDKGFWFKILKSSTKNLKPKSGDTVEFIYNVFDLNGTDIYVDDNVKPIK